MPFLDSVKPRNFRVSFLTKIKKKIYYENLNEKYVIDNNFFWKTVKRSLAHKMVGKNKIHLTDNNQLIETDPETVFRMCSITIKQLFLKILQNFQVNNFSLRPATLLKKDTGKDIFL